jgi:hypothetical protein
MGRRQVRNPSTYSREYDAARIAKIRAAFAKKSKASLVQRAKKASEKLTFQVRSKAMKKGRQRMAPQTKAKLLRNISSPDAIRKRNASIRKAMNRLSPEQLSQRVSLSWSRLTNSQKQARLRRSPVIVKKRIARLKRLNETIQRLKTQYYELSKPVDSMRRELRVMQVRGTPISQEFLKNFNAKVIELNKKENKIMSLAEEAESISNWINWKIN